MINFREQAKNSSTFCIMPFSHMCTKTTGEIKLCCRSLPLYNVKEKTLLEVWNSKKMKRVRKQVLSGERPVECNACFSLEDKNVISMRQRQNKMKCLYNNYLETLDGLKEDYSMPEKVRSIELKLNNLCNLKCRMCHPVDSTQWAKDWPHISKLQKHNEWTYKNVEEHNLVEHPYLCEWENHPSLFEDLKVLSDNLDTIWFAGGEPLIDPMHYKILEMLKNKNITLQYATNLTKIIFKNKSVFEYWKDFKKITVNISLDGVGDTFNYIRTNADFNVVVKNIRTIQSIAKSESIDLLMIAACTVQVYNIFDLPDITEFAIDNGLWFHTHRVTWPRFLSCTVLPVKLKNEVVEKISEYLYSIKQRTDLDIAQHKNIIAHLIDNLNFLQGSDSSKYWHEFIEYSKILDKITGSKLLEEVRPELKEYI